MYASNSASNWGRELRKLWKCCKSSFWRTNNGNNTNFWVVNPSFKVQRLLVNMLNAQDFHQWVKQIKNMKLRNILKTEESSQSVKLLTHWKFHVSVQSIWKTIWTCTDCHLYQRQCTCSLCPVSVCQFLVLQKVIPQFNRFSTMSLVALPQNALKEMRFNYVTLIQAKSWWTLAHFQTMHFTICCKWWCSHQQHCINSHRDQLWNRHRLEVKCPYRAINQSLN